MNFHDARLPRTDDMDISGGGAVETFTNTDDAKRWHDAINAFDRALGSGYDYRDGKRELRISSRLTPKQAAAYERAFRAIP